MSTPNFQTMENFPLYVWQLDRLPEQAELEEDNMTADEYIQTAYEIVYDNMVCTIENILKKTPLQFHKIEIKDGHYTGIQLYVNDENDGYGIPTDHDNESCRVIWDMCRSKAIRAYNSEINKVKRILKKIADLNGLIQIECVGIFSNGEAIYSIVQ